MDVTDYIPRGTPKPERRRRSRQEWLRDYALYVLISVVFCGVMFYALAVKELPPRPVIRGGFFLFIGMAIR